MQCCQLQKIFKQLIQASTHLFISSYEHVVTTSQFPLSINATQSYGFTVTQHHFQTSIETVFCKRKQYKKHLTVESM